MIFIMLSILIFSDKPLSNVLLLECCREKRTFMEGRSWNAIQLNRNKWTLVNNFEPTLNPTSDSLFPNLKAQLQQIITLVHILSSLSKLNFEQFEQLFVGMPCLHNQLHLQPNIKWKIKLKTFNQREWKYCLCLIYTKSILLF